MKKLNRLALAGAVATASISGATITYGAVGVEEVIVTARKREEAIQDVPVAITAVTSEALERAVIGDFEEATALTPGFSVPPASASPLALTLSMRGSVQTDTIVTMDPSVGVYVDGVYIARSYGIGVDLLDLQDIQVLKGPQGTLFGRNSTAGAMLINSKNPELGLNSATLSATGSPDLQKYSGIFNLSLHDTLALRVALQDSDRDDYVTNQANATKTWDSEIGGSRTQTYRAKLRFAPTEPLDMVLAWDKFDIGSKPATDQIWLSGNRAGFGAGADTVSQTFDSYVAADTETFTFVATYSADAWEAKFLASHRDWRHMRNLDVDGGDFAVDPAVRAGRRHGSWGREAGDQDSYELQFNSSLLDERIDLVAGILYFKEFGQLYDYSYGLDPRLTPPTPYVGGNYMENRVESLGYYSQATWHINDVSNLTVGLRYSTDDKDGRIYGSAASAGTTLLPSWNFNRHKAGLFNAQLPGRPPVTVSDLSESFDSVDWLVSYDYRVTDDLLVYVKASTGFRAGGFNGRGSDLNIPLVYDPEEILEYELGWKGDFFDRRLRWNTAVFTNETKDKQMTAILVSPTGGVPGTSVANAGKARAKGFETEFTYLLADNWSIAGSYAYIDSEVTEKKEGGVSVPSNQLPLPRYIPENQWSLVLNYDQEFSAFKLTGTATYTWIDEILGNDKSVTSLYQDSGGNLTMEQAQSAVDAYASDAYGLLSLNLMVSPLDDRYSVSLWCKNLLDERKISSTNSQITGSTYQYVSGRYTEPRMWGVTLTANF